MLIDVYLKYLQEREWDEPDNFSKYMKTDRFKNAVNNLDLGNLPDERQEMQPTHIGLVMTSGGDYKGRRKMSNAKMNKHTGLRKIKDRLPKDWEDLFRKSLDVDVEL